MGLTGLCPKVLHVIRIYPTYENNIESMYTFKQGLSQNPTKTPFGQENISKKNFQNIFGLIFK